MTEDQSNEARMTLIMSSRTLCSLTRLLERNPTPEQIAKVAPLLHRVALHLQHTHEKVSTP